MIIKNIMTKDFIKLLPYNTLKDAVVAFKENQNLNSIIIVNEQNKPVSIITQKELLEFIVEGQDLDSSLADVVRTKIIKVSIDQEVTNELKNNLNKIIVVDNDGQPLGVISREKFERFYLKRSVHHEMSSILDSIYSGLIAVDRDGRIIYFNKSAERITGLPKEDVLNKKAEDVFPEFKLSDVIRDIVCYVNLKTKFKKSVLLVNTMVILEGEDVFGAVTTFQDITRQESFLNEIKEMRNLVNYLDAIIDSSYDGIYITEKNGLTLRINSAYERITGVKREEVMGQYVEDLVKKGILSDSITKRVVKSRQPITILQRIKTGKQVVITGSPIFDEKGEVKGVVTNVRDVTELKNLYEQLERTKALTQKYKLEIQNLKGRQDIVASSKKMRQIMEKVNIISRVDSSVLLSGESGVGKEVVATAIHESSPRKDGPFIKINCGAIPENLLESELFGYEPGAFTGATKSKPGMFELANEGTLFLDEITEMPYKLQVKLLRVLQEQEIVRLGGIKSFKINARIIAATNKDINRMVSEGRFREDLYYRLNVVPIHIPPLRERKDDIPILANHFLKMFNKRYGMEKVFDKQVVDILTDYRWPGNVRELKNIIERLVVSSLNKSITIDDIPDSVFKKPENKDYSISVNKIVPLREAIEELEHQLVNKAWEQYKTTYEMAKALQISQPTASRKMRKHLSDSPVNN